ncbi:MAG TPA: sigma-70 family RNA polymerase sigma factor [Victivallales bacterium]|nr:sigma-70 family RNA polymerase sigma factor [Victivallales bacterium]
MYNNIEYSFRLFLKDIKQYRQLTGSETNKLIAEYQKILNQNYLNKVILGNIKFVISRSKRFQTRSIGFSDLIYAGIQGITRAAKKFDASRDVKFITYASYWIDMYMRREIIYNTSVVKISPRSWEMSSKISKLRSSGSTDSQIIQNLKIRRRTLSNLRSLKNDLSLNIENNDENSDKEYCKFILANTNTPASICLENDLNSFLIQELNLLGVRNKDIIMRRFGVSTNKRLTLSQLSKLHNISAERVRQVIDISIKKLRKRFKEEHIIYR